jgi:hypothetical protein
MCAYWAGPTQTIGSRSPSFGINSYLFASSHGNWASALHFFGDLSKMPSFSSRSPICQAAMQSFSQGLSQYPCADSWVPHPCAEAPGKLAKIATYAAISRVRPISDGPDQWQEYRKGTYTVGSGSLSSPMAGPELDPTTGETGTCDTRGVPLNTGGAFSLEG